MPTVPANTPLVTVVVPVYNVERYLDACVASVTEQTYTHLDIILVDDVSPDGCPAICDRWAREDTRIRVIHRAENGGLSEARNSGIDAARGDYLAFVDSDDVAEPTMIATLVDDALRHDADIVSAGAVRVSEDNATIIEAMCPPSRTMSGTQALEEFLYCTGGVLDCAWGKLYRASLFSGISGTSGADGAASAPLRFPRGLNSEDFYVNAVAFLLARRVHVNSTPLYRYRMRDGSIVHAGFTPHSFDRIVIGDMVADALRERGYANEAAIAYYRMQKHYDVLFSLARFHRPTPQIREYAARLRAAALPVYRDPRVTAARKMRVFLFSHASRVYYALNQRLRGAVHTQPQRTVSEIPGGQSQKTYTESQSVYVP